MARFIGVVMVATITIMFSACDDSSGTSGNNITTNNNDGNNTVVSKGPITFDRTVDQQGYLLHYRWYSVEDERIDMHRFVSWGEAAPLDIYRGHLEDSMRYNEGVAYLHWDISCPADSEEEDPTAPYYKSPKCGVGNGHVYVQNVYVYVATDRPVLAMRLAIRPDGRGFWKDEEYVNPGWEYTAGMFKIVNCSQGEGQDFWTCPVDYRIECGENSLAVIPLPWIEAPYDEVNAQEEQYPVYFESDFSNTTNVLDPQEGNLLQCAVQNAGTVPDYWTCTDKVTTFAYYTQ